MAHKQTVNPAAQLVEALRLRDLAAKFEEGAVLSALRACDGYIRPAADVLGIPHRTLDRLLRDGRLKHLYKETSQKIGRPPNR